MVALTLTSANFPPPHDILGPDLEMKIVSDFCKDLEPSHFEEAGCAVCGQLSLKHDLVHLKIMKNFLHILEEPDVTCEHIRSQMRRYMNIKILC